MCDSPLFRQQLRLFVFFHWSNSPSQTQTMFLRPDTAPAPRWRRRSDTSANTPPPHRPGVVRRRRRRGWRHPRPCYCFAVPSPLLPRRLLRRARARHPGRRCRRQRRPRHRALRTGGCRGRPVAAALPPRGCRARVCPSSGRGGGRRGGGGRRPAAAAATAGAAHALRKRAPTHSPCTLPLLLHGRLPRRPGCPRPRRTPQGGRRRALDVTLAGLAAAGWGGGRRRRWDSDAEAERARLAARLARALTARE